MKKKHINLKLKINKKTLIKGVLSLLILAALFLMALSLGYFNEKPLPKEQFATDHIISSGMELYVNHKYNFQFTYPAGIRLPYEMRGLCRAEAGAHTPLRIEEINQGFSDFEPLTVSVLYGEGSGCEEVTLFTVSVLEKSEDFNLDSFLFTRKLNGPIYLQDGPEALDFYENSKFSQEIVRLGDRKIPVMRNAKNVAFEKNTFDSYYFESDDYIYVLRHSYDKSGVDTFERNQNFDIYMDDYLNYHLSKSVIETFYTRDELRDIDFEKFTIKLPFGVGFRDSISINALTGARLYHFERENLDASNLLNMWIGHRGCVKLENSEIKIINGVQFLAYTYISGGHAEAPITITTDYCTLKNTETYQLTFTKHQWEELKNFLVDSLVEEVKLEFDEELEQLEFGFVD
jgi:hypothetical protein